jgi:hypothetical protein
MEKKKSFIVTIEEMVSKDFVVEATDYDEAEKIAEEKYNCGEFVLNPGNLVCKQMSIKDLSDNTECEWFEF